MKRIFRIFFILLFLILFFCSLLIGVADKVTFENLFLGNREAWQILFMSRMPRTLAIILSASGLGVAGLIMQSIMNNKFMSPTTSGINNGAVLGVFLAMLTLGFKIGVAQLMVTFMVTFLSSLVMIKIVSHLKTRDMIYLPLVGMMYGGVLSAIASLIAYQFDANETLSTIGTGTFNKFTSFKMLIFVLIPLVLSVVYATRFSVASMGKDYAKNVGLSYEKVILIGLFIIAVNSSAVALTIGPISFIGLIVPNIIRAIKGDDIKKSIFDVMLLGSIFVLLCDMLGRIIHYPYEIATGTITGIIGGIIFLIILFRRVRYGK